MEEKVFWELLGAACRMGRFVAAVPNSAASANIVGKLEIGRDGEETVLQRRKRPSAHIHFRPEAITQFAFTFVDPGSGAQPCLELRTREGDPALRLYYQGKKSAQRFEEFSERTRAHTDLVTGTWLAPAEAENKGIFVDGGRDGEGGPESAEAPQAAGDARDAAEGQDGGSRAGAAEVVNAS